MAAIRTVPCSSVRLLRLAHDAGTGLARLGDALVDVGHLERDVDDTVAVLGVVLDEQAGRAHGAVDDEADGAGLQDKALVVALAGLRA